jgi:hypothetical protein
MKIEVIDNFLPSFQFDSIQSFFMGENVAWFWRDNIVFNNEPGDNYQFNTAVYDYGREFNCFPLVQPCILKLRCSSINRIKANLRPKTLFHRRTPYHTDHSEPGNKFTSIFYVNTNNGWTKFKNGRKVKSVANRMVIFPCSLKHRGVSCTDQIKRVVINFNYEL